LSQSPPRTTARDRAACAAVGVLAASNVVTNRCLPPGGYVPWNLALTAALLAIARRSGCSTAELGLGFDRLPSSVRAGAAGAAVVAAGYALALRSDACSDLFRDDRATSLGAATARQYLLLRIPLGTVLAEEVAFRGVLPALVTSRRQWMPGAISSLLFGVWHILPSLELVRANVGVERAVGTSPGRAVALAVGTTALGGGVLQALRQRTGHLAAPAAVHLAANLLGFIGARVVGRRP
jgi:membrane protease YdiL (CAAX protease family)